MSPWKRNHVGAGKYPLVLLCPTLLSVQWLWSQNVFLRTMRPSVQFSTRNHGELLTAHRLASSCPGHHLWEALVLFPWEGRGCSSPFLEKPFILHRFLWDPWSWSFPWDKEQQSLWQCQELTCLQEEAGQEEGGWQRCCWNYTTGGGSSITRKKKWALNWSYSQIFSRN